MKSTKVPSTKVPSRAKPSRAKVPTKVPRKKYNKIGGQRSSNGSSTARSSSIPVLARDVRTIIPIIAKDLGKFEKASAPISKYAKKYDSLNTSRSRE